MAYYGRFATKVRGVSEVAIWELESCAPSVALEFRLATVVAAVAFDWLPLENGNHVLAVGADKALRIVHETGSKEVASFAIAWTDAASYSGLNSSCSCLCFVGTDGTLLVGTSKEIVVFTKVFFCSVLQPTGRLTLSFTVVARRAMLVHLPGR